MSVMSVMRLTHFPHTARGRRRAAFGPASPRIVLAEPDPYLTFLIQLHFPDAQVVEADQAEGALDILAGAADLVIASVESDIASDLMARPDSPKVLGIVEGTRAARTVVPPDLDGVLVRPFVPAELYRAIRRALGLPQPAGEGAPALERARSLVRYARFGAVAVAAVLDVGGGTVSHLSAVLLGFAFAYSAVRLVIKRGGRQAAWLDVAIAAVLVAVTGGLDSNYMFFGLVASAGAGLELGVWRGFLGGLIVADASAYEVIQRLLDRSVEPHQVAAWFLLFPLIALSTSFAARIWRLGEQGPPDRLVEANRVLSTLYRITRTMPGGLEIGTVAAATLGEIRTTLRAPAGALLAGESGLLLPVGSYGLQRPGDVAVDATTPGLADVVGGRSRVVALGELSPDLAGALGHNCWLAAPLRRSGVTLGLILAACPDHDRHGENRLFLQQLSEETAVAVENALLFSRVRALSVDEERRRLARELHDGIAQALTHLRLELDFVLRHGNLAPDTIREEIGRLVRVVERASGDVRSMVVGLRSSTSTDGLAGSLRSYLLDLKGLGGPDIAFDAQGEVHLSPEVEAEVFRIAQEAVSNVRHAAASNVRVSLEGVEGVMLLTVDDDGVGVTPDGVPAGGNPTRGTGVGLAAMRERAERINGRLSIGERPGGGTRVQLECPMQEAG
jgi:signal transduction histidine kinase